MGDTKIGFIVPRPFHKYTLTLFAPLTLLKLVDTGTSAPTPTETESLLIESSLPDASYDAIIITASPSFPVSFLTVAVAYTVPLDGISVIASPPSVAEATEDRQVIPAFPVGNL